MTHWRRQRVSERAYALWEAEGRQHGNDWAHWFQAEAEIPLPLRVTFDTGTLERACRPDRHPRDPRQPLMRKVNAALANGQILGFYSLTILTIEGIMKQDRANVFAGTRLVTQSETTGVIKNTDLPDAIREKVGSDDLETISIELRVEQPGRQPPHSETVARITAANALGLKVLKAVPRTGAEPITDPTGEYYLSRGDNAELRTWIEKIHEVAWEIEARGVGFAQVKELGQLMDVLDPTTIWFQSIDKAADIHQKREVERAFSEWADGDSVAAHVAYGIDIFCSCDFGKSNATKPSVLDVINRAWLTQTYGVRFMTLEELADSLS
jgi:hypothetical protein